MRLWRRETSVISHCHSGGHQKIRAWNVGWVPLEKENVLVQKGLVLVEDAFGWGSRAWTLHTHLASGEQSPQDSLHVNVLAGVTPGRKTPD